MKRFLAAMALACLLSVPTLAGDMPTIDYTPPPPPPPTSPATAGATPVDLQSGDEQQQMSETVEALFSIILGLLVR